MNRSAALRSALLDRFDESGKLFAPPLLVARATKIDRHTGIAQVARVALVDRQRLHVVETVEVDEERSWIS